VGYVRREWGTYQSKAIGEPFNVEMIPTRFNFQDIGIVMMQLLPKMLRVSLTRYYHKQTLHKGMLLIDVTVIKCVFRVLMKDISAFFIFSDELTMLIKRG
jgi:hypothetical protein